MTFPIFQQNLKLIIMIKYFKIVIKVGFLSLIIICFTSFAKIRSSKECDILNFYSIIEPSNLGTKVLTTLGQIEDVEAILVPTSIDPGKYAVKVTRKASNLFEIENKDIYLETNYCYEYAYNKEAILIVSSRYGYSKGKIIFE